MQVQEMGMSGESSLEPGVASGDVFWMAYPQPFLRHFYTRRTRIAFLPAIRISRCELLAARGQCGADLLARRPPLGPKHQPGIFGNPRLHRLERKVFMPLKKAIFQRYLRKFSKHGKLLDADLGLVVINDGGGGGTSDSHAVMLAATD